MTVQVTHAPYPAPPVEGACAPARAAGVVEVLLSGRYLPEVGGSIMWMHEVYRRWPAPVTVITHDYYAHPTLTPEFSDRPVRPASGDHASDRNLTLDRRDIFLHDWGLDRPGQWRRYGRMTAAVGERLRAGATVRVHCTHAVPEVVSLLPLRWRYGRRLRIVCYAHGEEITACRTSRQLTWMMRRAHRAVDVMLANSRNTASLLEGLIDPAKVHVVHPGVDVLQYASAAEMGRAWRARQGIAPGVPVLLCLGRLCRRKNQAALVRALAGLSHRFPDAVLCLAGRGPEEEALRRLVAESGLSARVRFEGAVDGDTKLALYGACDVFAMPAVRDGADIEGFGIVFLEAAACGKATVAGDSGGQPDAVLDGRTGLVVDGGDDAAVAQALERLLGDEGLRSEMGRRGLAHARDNDWSRVVERTLELASSHA